MKLADLIPRSKEITEGELKFFIAEDNFSFKGLPIIKDSLVFYNGRDEINVNMESFAVFHEENVPLIVKSKLPKDDYGNYMVEKCSSCENESVGLSFGDNGIWHIDHFDNWTGKFWDYLERIEDIPELEYQGLKFSSLLYGFNTSTETLSYFINVKPVNLQIAGHTVEFPSLLQISSDKDSYTIIPLEIFEYWGIAFRSVCTFAKESGIFSGWSADEFEAEILGYMGLSKIIIEDGSLLTVTMDGKILIDLLNDKTHKVEKFEIRKFNLPLKETNT